MPIFSVGSDQGVNYYAMQFIEGHSLDQVLRDATQPLDAEQVAQWGLQATEALAHAHQRNVIHRDVKPSNLILDDAEGRIWLTDFGLAKRLDDVTLSMTGAMLGTPRYMSPEQADAARRRVDHRTDLYSLGATLYELLTGKPVFSGDTPHGVLQQILADDPLPPRQHRPSLPRDLETIVMKCLSKEPSQRYESAQQVADDLRAFLDQRPIRARRPTLVDALVKSYQRQKQRVALTLGTVAATAAVIVASLISYYGYQQSQLAEVTLQTDTPPLVAELLGTPQESLSGPLSLPMMQPVRVRSGALQARVSGAGQLSQTYKISLAAGETQEFKVDLTDRRMRPPVAFNRGFQWVRERVGAGSQTVAVLVDAQGIHRVPLADTGSIRSVRIPPLAERNTNTNTWLEEAPGFKWWTDENRSGQRSGIDKFDRRPFVVGQLNDRRADAFTAAPDLDGDSIADLVIAGRHQAWLMAFSGKTMSRIWFAPRGRELDETSNRRGEVSATLAPPLRIDDLNGDGIADLLASFVDAGSNNQQPLRWLEAISGADGKQLWRADFDPKWFQLAPGVQVPYAFRWFYGSGSGSGSSGGGSWSNHNGIVTRSRRFAFERHGPSMFVADAPHVVPALSDIEHASQGVEQTDPPVSSQEIVCLAGQMLVRWRLDTGELSSAVALGTAPTRPLALADVNGDREPDVLLSEDLGEKATRSGYPLQRVQLPQTRLSAWSRAEQQPLWTYDTTAPPPSRTQWRLDAPEWPLMVDLNGDGAAEVIVPDGTSHKTKGWQSLPWGAIEVLDGKSGERLWFQRIANMDEWVERFVVGPDVDQDGWRDLFAATLWGEDYELFVDCLSGADGRTLWRHHHALRQSLRDGKEYVLGPLRWWDGAGGDWPSLIVSAAAAHSDDGLQACMISAGDGSLTHTVRDYAELFVAELDGDRIDDLSIVRPASSNAGQDGGGQLLCFRGIAGERWRQFGTSCQTVADLDNDGCCELAEKRWGRLAVTSGSTGAPLWETRLPSTLGDQVVIARDGFDGTLDVGGPISVYGQPSSADLNGDGHADIVICRKSGMDQDMRPLIALSGVGGRKLWTAELSIQYISDVLCLETRDLDSDGVFEVVMVAATDWGYPNGNGISSADQRLSVAVFSGRTGRLRWKQDLSDRYHSGNQPPYEFQNVVLDLLYEDLNGDGTLDLIAPSDSMAEPGQHLDLRAFDGADGEQLWSFPLERCPDLRRSFQSFPPGAVADLDGDGVAEVVQLSFSLTAKSSRREQKLATVSVIEGGSGRLRASWQTPVLSSFAESDYRPTEDRPRILVVHNADGTAMAGVTLQHEDRQVAFSVLDAEASLVQQVELVPSLPRPWRDRVYLHDVDGDGADDLLFQSGDELVACHWNQPDPPIWERKLEKEYGRQADAIGLRPGADGHVVLVRQGQSRLIAVDVANGKTVWQAVGPTPWKGESQSEVEAVELIAWQPGHAPLVYYGYDDVLVCREGAVLDRRFRGKVEVLDPDAQDPRLVRFLPWRSDGNDLVEFAATSSWMALYSLTLVIAPVGFVGWLIWKRQFGLKALLLAPVIVSLVFMGASLSGPDGQVRDQAEKWMMALFSTPPVVAAGLMILWSWSGNWRRVLLWITISLVAALVCVSFVVFLTPSGSAQPLPGERLSFSGWYLVWLPGALATAWILAGSWLLGKLAEVVAGRRKGAVRRAVA